MLIAKIHCIVIRVPSDVESNASAESPRSRHDALPWADPYILGLIAKLQREVKAERAARAGTFHGAQRWESAEMCDEMSAHDETCAGKVPPPPAASVATFFADDENERPFFEDGRRFGRLPR